MLIENKQKKILVLSSAGNTARAFLYICIKYNYPLVVIIPEYAVSKLWIPKNLKYNKNSKFPLIVSVKGDYADAINIANKLSQSNDIYISEGGARNIARRDGMGTVILDAVSLIKKLPDYYIQAVGSGTGGIAAYESSVRLIETGIYGNKIPIIYLIQNEPYSPLLNMHLQKERLDDYSDKIVDSVLYNRNPPYHIIGGVKDIIKLSNGDIIGVTNKESNYAKYIFEKIENIDISEASSVAVAGLIKLIKKNIIKENEIVLLNITSGGVKKFMKENKIQYILPNLTIESNLKIEDAIKKISEFIC